MRELFGLHEDLEEEELGEDASGRSSHGGPPDGRLAEVHDLRRRRRKGP